MPAPAKPARQAVIVQVTVEAIIGVLEGGQIVQKAKVPIADAPLARLGEAGAAIEAERARLQQQLDDQE